MDIRIVFKDLDMARAFCLAKGLKFNGKCTVSFSGRGG
jgi:hypothetical protein